MLNSSEEESPSPKPNLTEPEYSGSRDSVETLGETGRPATFAASSEVIEHELGAAAPAKHDPYLAFRSRDYTLYTMGSLVSNVGNQMQNVAVAWEIYDRVSRVSGMQQGAWALGLVGLIQALPVILLALPAGHMADRFSRKNIMLLAQAVLLLCWAGMAYLSFTHGPLEWLYLLLLFDGLANAMANPSRTAMVPQLVPPEAIASASTWNSARWQTSAMLGPALGGAAIAYFGRSFEVYIISIISSIIFIFFVLPIRPRAHERSNEPVSLQTLLGGASFVWSTPIILATVTLDMFAVLLGGAVALLPLYAKDILQVGAHGYGWLMASPAIGSVVTAFVMAHLPPFPRAGRVMLWAVAGFGLATIVFGISQNFYLSFAALVVTGACDSISVIVRHTLVQVLTPDHLRGRVSAINSVFIGVSNEIGSFESGAAARLLGPVRAVVFGGIGTVLVVMGVASKWPVIKNIGSLQDVAREFAARGEKPDDKPLEK